MVLIWSRIYAIWLIAISMIMILSCETFSLQHRMISAANCRLTGHVDRCRKETLTSSMRWWSQGGKVLLGPFYKAHVETSLRSISASKSRYCLAKKSWIPTPSHLQHPDVSCQVKTAAKSNLSRWRPRQWNN